MCKHSQLLIACFLFAASLCAQVPLDSPPLQEARPALCSPGVINRAPAKGISFTYSFNPDYVMRPVATEVAGKVRRNEFFDVRLRAPLYRSEKLKIILGFQYTLERYHFNQRSSENYPLFRHLDNTGLKNAGIAAMIVHPINHRFYSSFRLSANWQGDYEQFVNLGARYAVYRAAALLGFKKNEKLEYGVGVVASKDFQDVNFIPFGFYNQTFNKHWGIEFTIPSSFKVRYNFSERSIAQLGTELNNQNYSMLLNPQTGQQGLPHPVQRAPFNYQRSYFDIVGSYYQHLSGWAWVQLKLGYGININSRARDIPLRQDFDLRPSGAMVGMISFFLSPPKNLLEGK
ncbi:MAG: hypothetical protein RI973_374 [Bacteroidota bacterium]|jgi:hypothetical protein